MTTTKTLAAALAALGTRDELRALREHLLDDLTRWDGDAAERVLYDDVPAIAGRLLDALTIAVDTVPAALAGGTDAQTVIGFSTLQFSTGGLFDGQPVDDHVHLVRATRRGTPGPTLCGIDRFAPDAPGWSVGGGIIKEGATYFACPGCVETARRDFPGLTVGRDCTFRRVFDGLLAEAVTSRG